MFIRPSFLDHFHRTSDFCLADKDILVRLNVCRKLALKIKFPRVPHIIIFPCLIYFQEPSPSLTYQHRVYQLQIINMSTATMHFGPEWMRTKNQPHARSQQPSPPPPNALPQAPTLATYSALVSVIPVASEKLDESRPFRYSKEELLAIYQVGGGKGGLGLEVDRWQGVVREVAAEPVTLREMNDAEKKVCCC
jgi:hypothetical protein